MDERRKTKCGFNDDDTTGCLMRRTFRVINVTENDIIPLLTRELVFEIIVERL